MRRLFLFVLLPLLFAVPLPVAGQSYDWCYEIDFRRQNVLTLSEGNWFDNLGYRNDITTLRLAGSYNHPVPIRPLQVRLRFWNSRAEVTNLSGAASVFGIPITIDHDMPVSPAIYDLFAVPVTPDTTGSSLSIDVVAEWYFNLESVAVYGNDVNPFGATNCEAEQIDFPSNGLIDALATANASLNSIGSDLDVPGAAVPSESGLTIFSYAKWMLTSGAVEIAGPFGVPFQHIGTGMTLLVGLGGLYALLYVIVFIVRWVIWLFKNWQVFIVIAIIIAIGAAVNAIVQGVFNLLPG